MQQGTTCNCDSPQQDTESSPGWFMLNLGLLLGLGVSVLYWIGYHTELIGVVGGLLGLGGVLAWVAFLFNIVREERKIELQLWFDGILSKKWMVLPFLVMALVLAGVGSMFGSVRIDARREVTDRFVEIRDTQSGNPRVLRAEVLPARSMRTFPFFAGWSGRKYEVRVVKLPVLEVKATQYHRETIVSPDGFLRRNIVLIRPTTELSQTARKAETQFDLTFKIGENGPETLANFRGESVWIGCDYKVAIPTILRERWRLLLAAQNPPVPEARMLPWLSPRALGERRTLAPGDRIKISLGHPGEKPYIETNAIVEECGRPDCFPQEVILHAQ